MCSCMRYTDVPFTSHLQHICSRLCTYVYMHIYVCMHAYVYWCVCASMTLFDASRSCCWDFMYVYRCACTCMCICVCMYACICACAYVCILVYICVSVYMYAYTCMCTRVTGCCLVEWPGAVSSRGKDWCVEVPPNNRHGPVRSLWAKACSP